MNVQTLKPNCLVNAVSGRWSDQPDMYMKHVNLVKAVCSCWINSDSLVQLDDPECVVRWAACLARFFPALRMARSWVLRQGNGSQESRDFEESLATLETMAFAKLIEKMQGTGLAALYYGNPNRDRDETRFRGSPSAQTLNHVSLLNSAAVWNLGNVFQRPSTSVCRLEPKLCPECDPHDRFRTWDRQ